MEIPHRQLLAPRPAATTLAEIENGARVAALDGRRVEVAGLPPSHALETLWASRVGRDAAVAIGQLPALSRLVIHDYREADLSPLAGLGVLTSLAVAGSPKLRDLAGLERLTGLTELILFDNCNYTHLAPLAGLGHLETLCLEGGFSKPLRVETLAPLAWLTRLRRLRLASIRVEDKSLAPLHGLTALREVFVAATFPKAELAAMAAALPEAGGEFLDSQRQ